MYSYSAAVSILVACDAGTTSPDSNPNEGPDGTAEMDGAILVVAAADGPMPQTNRNAETLQIDFRSGRIDADGIYFAGTAVVRVENGERAFDITGSARRQCDNPDCLICDIVGSDVYDGAKFQTRAVLVDLTGS